MTARTYHAMDDVSELERARRLARLMDAAVTIPGTRITVGLDALLGLVPGLGDAIGVALSAQIVLAAARVGAPFRVLLEMVANVLLDAAVGAIPILGDVFDVVYRANTRNYRMLERVVASGPITPRPANRRVVAAVLVVLGLLVLAIVLVATVFWRAFAALFG
jgi:hypothetical protein